ncbi:uncharacterized protein DDB_G0290685-like [Strongylocentrotus purpuratus]|uniref:PHD-type domain-containing protein n=1 Tax=Strongylocentrotus purpuratus TaxID=7668 RepID=A0A7M7P535_STRPU|nr:uncharacterized protein DDB_G0290685-like [Strongylocentrotus purpuratus]
MKRLVTTEALFNLLKEWPNIDQLDTTGYRPPLCAWTELATSLRLKNSIGNRKWLYNQWKKNAERLRDRVLEARKLYCVCRTRNDETKPMLACDKCEEWFHHKCIGMRNSPSIKKIYFLCPNCTKTSKKPCSTNDLSQGANSAFSFEPQDNAKVPAPADRDLIQDDSHANSSIADPSLVDISQTDCSGQANSEDDDIHVFKGGASVGKPSTTKDPSDNDQSIHNGAIPDGDSNNESTSDNSEDDDRSKGKGVHVPRTTTEPDNDQSIHDGAKPDDDFNNESTTDNSEDEDRSKGKGVHVPQTTTEPDNDQSIHNGAIPDDDSNNESTSDSSEDDDRSKGKGVHVPRTTTEPDNDQSIHDGAISDDACNNVSTSDNSEDEDRSKGKGVHEPSTHTEPDDEAILVETSSNDSTSESNTENEDIFVDGTHSEFFCITFIFVSYLSSTICDYHFCTVSLLV